VRIDFLEGLSGLAVRADLFLVGGGPESG